jgi:hypothetical protein
MAQSNTFLIFCIFFILIGGIIGLAVFLGITFHRLDAEKKKVKEGDGDGGGDGGGGGGGSGDGGSTCPNSKRATLLDKETTLKFDSANFDKYWIKENSWHGGGNYELQSYSADNVSSQMGSQLVIEAKKQEKNGKRFTSGKIVGKVGLKRGKVSFTAILPSGKGLWPALWLMPDDIALNQSGGDLYSCSTWPATGEIDVMEMNGGDAGQILHTVHSGLNYKCKLPIENVWVGGPWADGKPHTFSVTWDETKMVFGVDSNTNTRTITFADHWDVSTTCNPKDEFFMDGTKTCPQPVGKICNPFTRDTVFVPIINLAVGGLFVNNPTVEELLSGTFPDNQPKTMTIMDVKITPST